MWTVLGFTLLCPLLGTSLASPEKCNLDDEGSLLQLGMSSKSKAQPDYFWPAARGRVGSYGVSNTAVNLVNISSPTWTWQSERGRWGSMPWGTAIDDQKNIFVTLENGIKKFSQDGEILWHYDYPGVWKIGHAAALFEGKVIAIDLKARVFALNMETGEEIWSTKIGINCNANNGEVAVHNGTVIVAAATPSSFLPHANGQHNGADNKVVGLNASNGRISWEFVPEVPVWNFAASFAGDGTFVFQTMEGTVYRNRVIDGSMIWKQGGEPGSWTDGAATVAPDVGSDGIVYAPANFPPARPGYMAAFRLSDGNLVWNQSMTWPPNAFPVVGRVAGHTGKALVIPAGQQCVEGLHVHVNAFDAETGRPLWSFEGPALHNMFDAFGPRQLPNPWGQPAIDSKGVVYVGSETGHFFSIQDANGDGKVAMNDSAEVSVFHNGGSFGGSSGPAIAPGLMALGAVDSLYVWKWSSGAPGPSLGL